MLVAGALPALTGCVLEPGAEPDQDGSELAGEISPASDPCNSPFNPDPELTLAIPLLMYKAGSSPRLPVDTGWYTLVRIQNTSPSLATVRLRAISTTGAQHCTIFWLGSEEAVTFRPDNGPGENTVGIPTLPPGTFEGSMLIETDQRLAAVAKLSNVPLDGMGRPGGTASADYQGLSMKTGATGLGYSHAYPVLKSGFYGKSTTLFVQNVDAWADWLTVEVRTNDAKVYSYSVYVPARRSVAIQPSQFRDGAGRPMPVACPPGPPDPGEPGAPCFGSVRVVQGWQVNARFRAIAVERPVSGNAPAIHAAHFEDVGMASNRQWIPVVKYEYQGATTGIVIMNASSAHHDATVILRTKTDPPATYSRTFWNIPPYSSIAVAPDMIGFPRGEIGTAEISSTGQISVVANEAAGTGSVSFHHALGTPGDLAAPMIKVAWFNRQTQTTLWNVGSVAVQIDATLLCHTATSSTYSEHTFSMIVEPNHVVDFEPVNIPAGNLCSAIFTTEQQTLVGTFAEVSLAEPIMDGSIYEGIVLD